VERMEEREGGEAGNTAGAETLTLKISPGFWAEEHQHRPLRGRSVSGPSLTRRELRELGVLHPLGSESELR
jgi:hypothetical protein